MHPYQTLYSLNKMMRNARKIQLPEDFANRLLECEIEYKLSGQPSKQIVKPLIELYTLGVEYYESIRSHKYLYFQQKMNEIFMSATTLSSINQEGAQSEAESPLKKKLKGSHEEDKILALQIKRKQEKMLIQIAENTNDKATVSTVKQMINENDLKSQEVRQKLNKEMEEQESKLKQKLDKRKSRALLSKSFSSAGIIGEAETKESLFPDFIGNESHGKIVVKPIEVSFETIIKENESDEDEAEAHMRRRVSVSQDPTKKNQKSKS